MNEQPELVSGTKKGQNKFKEFLFLKVNANGTIEPLEKSQRDEAVHTLKLTLRYPSYQLEMQIKARALKFDEKNNYHYNDTDIITEERIRNCLVQWNLHEIFPEDYKVLLSVRQVLDDSSMDQWEELPPKLRKAISATVNYAIGGIS